MPTNLHTKYINNPYLSSPIQSKMKKKKKAIDPSLIWMKANPAILKAADDYIKNTEDIAFEEVTNLLPEPKPSDVSPENESK